MPTYEYHCAGCRATYELRESFSAETTHTCQECGNGVARRVLHAPRVVFKGSGFYATDSRKATTSVADADSKTETAETKAEATPASDSSSTSTDASDTTAAAAG